MIQQFRTLTPINLLYLFLFGVFMNLSAFFKLPQNLSPTLFEPAISNLIGNALPQSITPKLNLLLAFLITLAQGLQLNKVVNKYNLLGRATFLPALLYIALACSLSSFLTLTPPLLCNFLLIAMIDRFLNIYHKADCKGALFDLGFMIGIGTLFYFPFIAFLPLLWISLLIFKPFNWREWLTGLIGFLTIYTLLALTYFWQDKTNELRFLWHGFNQKTPHFLPQDLHDYLVLVIPCLILVLFTIFLRKNFYKSTVHIRKSIQLTSVLLLASFGSIFLAQDFWQYHFLLSLPPLAIYMAYYFNYANKKWVFEPLFLLMVLGFIYFQWF